MSLKQSSSGAAAGRRAPGILIGALIALALAATAKPAAAAGAPQAPMPMTAPAASGGSYLPALDLVDQNGRAVKLSSFRGKPVLLGFIHTSCKGVCEMMTAKMKQVATALGSGFHTRVTMVSITTDPREDNSAQLLKYARAQGANARGFVFLTGKTGQIDQVLKLYDIQPEGPDDDMKMTHVLNLFLIDPDGRTMRKYNGMAVPSESLASAIRGSVAGH